MNNKDYKKDERLKDVVKYVERTLKPHSEEDMRDIKVTSGFTSECFSETEREEIRRFINQTWEDTIQHNIKIFNNYEWKLLKFILKNKFRSILGKEHKIYKIPSPDYKIFDKFDENKKIMSS